MTALAIFGLMSVAPVCAPPPLARPTPPAENRVEAAAAPYGDILGDAWEIEEVSCWRGI
jgi:hypothetical protein